MTPRSALIAGAFAFAVLATANSGGYRYGISDQAFYIPAVAHAADPALFPRDFAVFAPQTRRWLGDELLGFVVRMTHVGTPGLFALLYLAGVLLLFGAGVFLARGLGASWWAVAGTTALLTLRHRIAKTGANSLEGYMHPRMIAFALGLFALGFMARRRWAPAVVMVVIAGVAHPSTALWFACAVAGQWAWRIGRRPITLRNLPLHGALAFVVLALALLVTTSPPLRELQISVLAEKDYLYPSRWPAYAWALNLLYPVVIIALYRRRLRVGLVRPGEPPLVTGLLLLVVGFLISVPMAAAGHNALIVQLQVNRIFWLLDAVALTYVAWWLVDDVAARRGLQRWTAGLLVALATGRGIFILADSGRAFAQFDLAPGDWTDAMRWLREQPKDWQVIADPGHAYKYGTSVRVAALRDTMLEQSKDAAMALYDNMVAARVSDRSVALYSFDRFTASEFRDLGRRYDARALVLERSRPMDLPKLYENAGFVIYDLR